jgi:Protein of unknown function (DUF3047)
MRHRVMTIAAVLFVAAAAGAADDFLVEDWKQKLGATGIPPGWQGQNWGSPKYDFKVEESDGRAALHMKSVNEGSTISRDIKGKVNLTETPILEWTWKAVVLPKNGNSCKKSTDDQALQLFVVWPRFPEAVRSRIIGYVWDTTQPAGTICKSEKTGTVTYIVLRSGSADLGKWLTERRNVVEDFTKIYGEAPDNAAAVSVSIDSNDTNSASESLMAALAFRRK